MTKKEQLDLIVKTSFYVLIIVIIIGAGMFFLGRSSAMSVASNNKELLSAMSMFSGPAVQPAVTDAETADEAAAVEEEAVDEPAEVVEVEAPKPFYDIDPKLENFENPDNNNMSYTCKAGDLAVVFSMDPGNFEGYSTGELGAAMGAECEEGEVINITTPHWSPSALHWQVHGVAVVDPDLDPKELTLEVADNDGKKLAVWIPLKGDAEVLLGQ